MMEGQLVNKMLREYVMTSGQFTVWRECYGVCESVDIHNDRNSFEITAHFKNGLTGKTAAITTFIYFPDVMAWMRSRK